MTAYTDEEQADRLKAFLKTYGSAMLSGILIALIAFFGWQYWHNKQAANRFKLAHDYQQLTETGQRLALTPDDKAAHTQFYAQTDALVKQDPNGGYAIQALFLGAKLASAKQDYALAEKQLSQITSSKIKDDGLKQLAWLRLAAMQAAQAKYDPALNSLKNVTDDAFSASVNEAKGDILLLKKDTAGAKAAYQAAWDASVKREEPRELVKLKLESLGVSVPDVKIDGPIRQPAAGV